SSAAGDRPDNSFSSLKGVQYHSTCPQQSAAFLKKSCIPQFDGLLCTSWEQGNRPLKLVAHSATGEHSRAGRVSTCYEFSSP
ncbi:unnamed protein product, partial [Ixodes pacificus]